MRCRNVLKGFSVVELIVTILIMSILAGSFYLIIMIAVDAWNLSTVMTNIRLDGMEALDYIMRDIRHMDVSWYYNVITGAQRWDPASGDPVDITSTWSSGIATGEKQHLLFNKGEYFHWGKSYFSTSPASDYRYDAANRTIVLSYAWGIWNGVAYGFYDTRTLATDVTDFQFSYSWGDGNWVNTWPGYPYGDRANPTPLFVRLQFTITRFGQSQTFAGTVAVRKRVNLYDIGWFYYPGM